MLRKILAVLGLLALLSLPFPARGEGTFAGRFWHLPQVAEKLNLSNEQKQRLDDLFQGNRSRLIDLKSALEKERLELENLLIKDPLDEDTVMAQYRRLETARANLGTERLRYALGVRKILGPDRFRHLMVVWKAVAGRRLKALQGLDSN